MIYIDGLIANLDGKLQQALIPVYHILSTLLPNAALATQPQCKLEAVPSLHQPTQHFKMATGCWVFQDTLSTAAAGQCRGQSAPVHTNPQAVQSTNTVTQVKHKAE